MTKSLIRGSSCFFYAEDLSAGDAGGEPTTQYNVAVSLSLMRHVLALPWSDLQQMDTGSGKTHIVSLNIFLFPSLLPISTIILLSKLLLFNGRHTFVEF